MRQVHCALTKITIHSLNQENWTTVTAFKGKITVFLHGAVDNKNQTLPCCSGKLCVLITYVKKNIFN